MRMTRPIAAALLLALAPTTGTVPVLAQAAADDPPTAMARARFKEGVEFYDKGEYEQARASFLQAYALKRHPAVLLNLAWSCLKSGHPLDAARYFKQFLAEGRDINERQRADANDGLNQAHAKLGRIEVVAAAGTEVIVDGERIGTAPVAEPVIVEAGAHTIKVKGIDGAAETQSISVLGGEKAVARFKTVLPPSPPAPAPAPAPTADVAPAPASTVASPAARPAPEESPPPVDRSPGPQPLPAEADKKGGALSAPKNLVPVFVLGVGALAGYGVAAAMFIFKQSAQDKANSIAAQLKMRNQDCPASPAVPAYPDACNAYHTDISNVNDDATIGNVALGVGVAATAGALVYWLVADKQEDVSARAWPLLTPMIGTSVGGASLTGRF